MAKLNKEHLKLILLLFKDGRESLTQLAKGCNVSKEVLRYRFLKLQKENYDESNLD